jgi:S-sulfo-L-cysteine synthase (3-phospho-L-serine-dependent)
VTGTFAVVETQLSRFGLSPFVAARSLGMSPVFVTSKPDRYAGLAGLDALVDRVVEVDTATAGPVLDAVSGLPDLRAVCTFTDYSVHVVAEVARELGLPGVDPEAALAARDKLRTRRRCEQAGVPAPRFAWALTEADAVAAATEFGLPCVVKPATEAGSIGVRLCRDVEQVRAQFRTLAARETDFRGQARRAGALVEEYLLGHEVSVESILVAGRREVIGVVDKILGPHPHFVEMGESFPSVLPDPVLREAAEVAVAALDAIGHDFGAAHVELKITGAGARLVEINSRPPGAEVTRLVRHATGIDLPLEVARLYSGLPVEIAATRFAAAAVRYLVSHRAGVLCQVRGVDLARRVAGVVEVEVEVEPGAEVAAATSNVDVLGHVLAVGRTPGEAVRSVDTALGQFVVEVRP